MIKLFAKFILSGSLIYWLINTKKLDLSLIKSLVSDHLSVLFIGCMCIISSAIFSAYRWRFLLETKTMKKISIFNTLRLTWIGIFFSSFLPGAITGDLVKIAYAKNIHPKLTKTFLLTSALMDRVLGLIGLLLLLGVFTLLNYNSLIYLSPEVKKLIITNFLLLLAVVIFLYVLFLPEKWRNYILTITNKLPLIGSQSKKTLSQIWIIGKNKKTVIICLLLSVVMQSINVFAIWYLASPFFDKDLSLSVAFSFIPLGLISLAIPISPAGLGVGHFIFSSLFTYFGVKNGASLFNLYFILLIGINFTGIIPYIFTSKKSLTP
jgi:hypothetical protein